ncbi:MAG: hypothetical protein HY610_00890, partial [Elusimicrobia bacterium]|nr:hypothetical protein [Elusimicrobiota bacterium]
LERGDQRKEVPFQLIVDVQPPLLKNVRRLNIKETLFSSRETAANIFSRKEIGVAVDVQDDRSTVTVRVALANSFEDLNQILSNGQDKVFPATGTTISLPENRLTYLGLIAIDEAGNSSSLATFPLIYDTAPPRVDIQSLEQKGADLKTFDRTHLWVHLRESEPEIVPARVDISVSIWENGPWHLLTRSVIEDAPDSSHWIWNEILGEPEWQSIRKIGETVAPISVNISQVKSALAITRFPGEGDQATFYWRARSKDFAGNEYVSGPKPFTLTVDRRSPNISFFKREFEIIDFGENGSLIAGEVRDDPVEDSSLKLELVKEGKVISETFTGRRVEGEFGLPIPRELSHLFPNGRIPDLKVVATDVDGNRSEIPVAAVVSVQPFQVDIPDPLPVQWISDPEGNGGEMRLDFPVSPNSRLSFKLDGKDVLKEFPVGLTSQFNRVLPLSWSPRSERALAAIRMTKEGKSISKILTVAFQSPESNADFPELMDIPDPQYSRSDIVSDRSKKSSLQIKGHFKENSEIALEVDGKIWVSGVRTGTRKDFEDRFESEAKIQEGKHKARIILKHGKDEISKEFTMIVDNSPPKIQEIRETSSNRLLKSESENSFNRTRLDIFVKFLEPHLKESKYFLGMDPADLFHPSNPGSPYSQNLSLSIPAGTSAYLGLESEDRSGLTSRQIYFVSVDTILPVVPTLKIALRQHDEVILEGQTESDPAGAIVLVDGRGNVLGKASPFLKDESGRQGDPPVFQSGDLRASWTKKLDKLVPGDYEIFAYAEDAAGNRSQTVGPERFTVLTPENLKPRLADISEGRRVYTLSSRPALSGESGIPHVPVQIFETGNYLGSAFSDSNGSFTFQPLSDLKNGWKNFTAVVFDSNGQKFESDLLRIYLSAPERGVTGILSSQREISFSPNGDGMNDVLQFDSQEVPITIWQFQRGDVVKTVRTEDGFRWDGRKEDGSNSETDLYFCH